LPRLAFAGLRDITLLVWPVFMIARVWKKSVEEKLGKVCNPANNKPVQPKDAGTEISRPAGASPSGVQ